MSKISEQKALEAYPEHRVTRYGPLYAYDGTDTPSEYDENIITRKAFIESYDQAMQDFLEKAEEFLYLQLNNGSIECGNIEKLIDNFKKHMQNEM